MRHAGSILKKARELRELTQSQLAKRMNFPPGYISKGELAENMTMRRFEGTLAALDFEIKVVDLQKRRDKLAAEENRDKLAKDEPLRRWFLAKNTIPIAR